MVGQSEAFWKHCGPILREHLPQTSDCSNADFYNYVNKVLVDGLIRVDADELTYPLHVCVRFEIEKGLFNGSIAVEDLPRVWNDKMEEYLGVVPPNDTLGVLQDVHWSDGSFGYFPSYTLGAMYACQVSACSGPRREGPRTDSKKKFYEHAKASIPDLEAKVAAGDFKELLEMLRSSIHQVGSLYPSADELCEAVTGKPLDPKVFVAYLTAKYEALYDL